MLEKHFALRDRTKSFALRVIKLCDSLPKTDVGRTIGRQLLRSGTSVAANYRAVGRARSQAEFTAKLGVVIEEADESMFWLELIAESELIPQQRIVDLTAEASELLAIFVASRRTSRRPSKGDKPNRVPDHRIIRLPDHPITGSPDLSITGSPDLSITGSPDLSITGSPDLSITGSPDLSITGSPDKENGHASGNFSAH
jgi:four helix bundle protein